MICHPEPKSNNPREAMSWVNRFGVPWPSAQDDIGAFLDDPPLSDRVAVSLVTMLDCGVKKAALMLRS